MAKLDALAHWAQLNDRQRTYLRVLRAVEIEVEEYEKAAWTEGRERRKAEVRRWLDYGSVPLSSVLGPVQAALNAVVPTIPAPAPRWPSSPSVA